MLISRDETNYYYFILNIIIVITIFRQNSMVKAINLEFSILENTIYKMNTQ